MAVLSEETLLRTLEARFRQGRIYTDNGPMLIAVNPFRPLPLYGPEQLAAYVEEGRRAMPPHIFKLAARAFSELQLDRRSQAILVSILLTTYYLLLTTHCLLLLLLQVAGHPSLWREWRRQDRDDQGGAQDPLGTVGGDGGRRRR